MKRTLLVLSFFASVLMIAACGKRGALEEGSVSKRTARGASAVLQTSLNSGIPTSPPEDKTWGEIVGEPPEAFHLSVAGLLQATLSPSEIGFISGRTGQSTGVKFWGNVELPTGPLNALGQGATPILINQSSLRLVVWDQLAGTTDVNGNRLPEIAIAFSQAVSGTVSGNAATLVFQDRYGEVTMQGNFNASLFQGQISYRNFTSYSANVPTRAEVLGTFSVQTCGFFRCL